ncbi:MAG: adenosylcobinamide-GDP ribazoletransferase [Janthinobacterium lividum]
MWNSFALAVQTMTGFSVLSGQAVSRADARRAVFLLPVIGAVVGAFLAAVWAVGNRLWVGQPMVPAALTLAAGLWLTGGRGLGGVARSADGLAAHGAGGDRMRAFAVMRDPRRGTQGLVALGGLLALRLAFLSALPPALAWQILVLTGALGGWATAFAYSAFPVAAASEDAPGLADAGPNEFLAATAVVIACGAILPRVGLLVLVAAALVAGASAYSVNRTLGGLNRPLCAALGEIAELTALACLTIRF